jgi:hypothetical protein
VRLREILEGRSISHSVTIVTFNQFKNVIVFHIIFLGR